MVTSSPKPLRRAGSIQNAHVKRKHREAVCTPVCCALILHKRLHQAHSDTADTHTSHLPLSYKTYVSLLFCSVLLYISERAPLTLHCLLMERVTLACGMSVPCQLQTDTYIIFSSLYCMHFAVSTVCASPQRYRSHFKVLCRSNISTHGIVCNYKTELSTAEMKLLRKKVSVIFLL